MHKYCYGMSKYTDTTVKLDASVVREAASVLEPGQTLTSYVRQVVQRDIQRRKLKQAARVYREFLEKDPEERKDLEDWERADLARTPAPKSRAQR